MANFNNKTKTELMEIIEAKETEILELKEELRLLEKCQKYDDVTDEIRGVYDKLLAKGFMTDEALTIVQTMIKAGQIPVNPSYNRGYRTYR